MSEWATIVSIVTVLTGAAVGGVFLWFRISNQVSSMSQPLAQRCALLEQRLDDAVRQISGVQRDLMRFREEVAKTYAPVTRISNMETHILEAIRDIQETLSEIRVSLTSLRTAMEAIEKRVTAVEQKRV